MKIIDVDSLSKEFNFNGQKTENSLLYSVLKNEKDSDLEFYLKKDRENHWFLQFNTFEKAEINCNSGNSENQKNLLTELKRLLKKQSGYAINFDEDVKSGDSENGINQTDIIYIEENDTVAKYLFRSGYKVFLEKKEMQIELDEKGRLFSAKPVLCINDSNECSLALRTDEKFITLKTFPLSHKYIAAGKNIFYCPETGVNYSRICDFEGQIPESQMELYLSVFASAFPEIQINYRDFESVLLEPVKAEGGLQFKSLDEEGTLRIDYLEYLEGYGTDFISRIRPDFVVKISEEKRRVEIRKVIYSTAGNFFMIKNRVGKDSVINGNTIYLSASNALTFLSENLGFLAKNYRLFGTDEIKKFKFKYSQPKTNLKISSGIDYFATECDIEIEGQHFDFESALKLFDENNYIPLNDGTKAIIDEKFFAKLRRILSRKDKNGEYKLTFFDLPYVESLIDSKIEGEYFEHSRSVYDGLNKIGDSELNMSEVHADLRDYQLYGARWMTYLARNNLGGCLADDMGLGKTLQTIALLKQLNESALIVVPKSLVSNWKNEIEKFSPETDAFIYYGADRNFDDARNHQVVITTYAMVRNDIENLSSLDFGVIVLDEVQAIKNIHSQIAKAVMLLNGRHRFALSGTPMENNLLELYSIFRFLNPAMFGSDQDFNVRYATPVQKNGDQEALEELRMRIKPFILRRLKNQVAKELPERTEQVVYVEMSDEQKVLYEKQRKFYSESIHSSVSKQGFNKSTFLILQGLMELRQLATVPESKTEGAVEGAKWNVLMENLCDVTAAGHKCLVFSNFLTSIDEIASRLKKEGINFVTMTGATTNRAEVVKKFQNDPTCKVFIMTLKTGGVGLNLTQADYVFITDPWWNTSAEQQAIDRTHRIGQTKNVFCYRLIAKNTIEEKIMQLQKQKKDLFDSVISSDGQMMKKLSEEDINFILNDM